VLIISVSRGWSRCHFVDLHDFIVNLTFTVIVVDVVHFDVQLVSSIKLGVLQQEPLAVLLRQLVVHLLSLIVLPPGQAERLVGHTTDKTLLGLGGGLSWWSVGAGSSLNELDGSGWLTLDFFLEDIPKIVFLPLLRGCRIR